VLVTLAFRHLLIRKLRALALLAGFALGVGVMIVLLSVGEAMLEQSRDVSLVGGGEVTVLPQGIDVEAMRTGGVSGMYFGIDRARFLTRQALGGPRHAPFVSAVAPAVEGKLLYARRGGRAVPVRAGGEVPSRAAAVGAAIAVVAGSWTDSPADSAYVAPSRQQLYDELDHFHLPRTADSSWAEWHYFNVVVSSEEWWYVTYLVRGAVERGDWGGQLLLTHRRPDGRYQRWTRNVPSPRITLDTARADLALGSNTVEQRDGVYSLRAVAGDARLDLTVTPLPNRYFPSIELAGVWFVSGYVVPGLVASASGTLCVAARCVRIDGAPAYHDHNWGIWRDVTWEWGAARGRNIALLYGGVRTGPPAAAAAPFFLAIVDSLGVRQVLRFREVRYIGGGPLAEAPDVRAPSRLELLASRDADSVRLRVIVADAHATRMNAAGVRRFFLQMRGSFELEGRVGGAAVADSGTGFFETYLTPSGASRPARSPRPM
jgi:hypothetical protein